MTEANGQVHPVEEEASYDEQGAHREFDFDLVYYLSGPMSGIKDYNYPQFAFATEALRANGVKIISPHEIPAPDPQDYGSEQAVWEYYMDQCQDQCEEAQGLILLPGWPFSKGSRQEIVWMHGDTGCPTYFFSPNKLQLTDMNFPKETIFSDGPPAGTSPTAA